MTWDDFEFYNPEQAPAADPWQGFEFADQEVNTGIQDLGLGSLDDILGGDISRITLENYVNPPEPRQESYRERAMRNAARRKEFLDENPMEFEPLDTQTQALLGTEQGLFDLGRAGSGLADMVRIPGARGAAQYFGDKSSELEELTSGPGTNAGNALQVLGRGAMSILPTLAAGPLAGFPGAILAAAGQSAGGVFEDAQDAYIQRGLSPDEARGRSYVPAIAAGLVTGLVTGGFGRTGVEALSRGLSADAIKGALRTPLMTILKGASKEALEEALDQTGQAVIETLTFNPDKKIEEAIFEIFQAGGLGFVLGGMGEVTQESLAGLASVGRKLNQNDLDAGPAGPDATGDEWAQFEEVGQEIPQQPPGAPGAPVPGPEPVPSAPGEAPGMDIPEFEPAPAPASEPVTPEEAAPSLRSRRGRGVQGAGEAIVVALGADQDTASDFVAEWLKANPGVSVGEQFRNDLITAYRASGLAAENADKGYSENVDDYLRMGNDPATAQEYVSRAKEANLQRKASLRSRNKERMAGIRRGVRGRLSESVARSPEIVSEPSVTAVPEIVTDNAAPIVEDDSQVVARDPLQDVAALRASERQDLPPEGRPVDRRERLKFLNKRSEARARTAEHEMGWDDLQEAIDLNEKIIDDDVATVPEQADGVRLEGKDGRYVLITRSVKPGNEGNWQTTAFDERGPWMDSNFPTLKQAVSSWLGKYGTKTYGPPHASSGAYRIGEVRIKKPVPAAKPTKAKLAPTKPAPAVQPVPAPASERKAIDVLNTELVKEGLPKWSEIKTLEEFDRVTRVIRRLPTRTQSLIPEFEKMMEIVKRTNRERAAAKKAAEPNRRTRAEEQELRELSRKKRLGPKQQARKAALEAKTPFEKKRQASKEHGDIIEFMLGHGIKIRGKKYMHEGEEGYYNDAYQEVIRRNALKPLFSKTGQGPDGALQALREQEGPDGKPYLPDSASVDDLWDLLLKAADGRQGNVVAARRENVALDEGAQAATDFAEIALENKRDTKKAQKGAKPYPVAEMIAGDSFEIDGEEFVVGEMEIDPDTGEIGTVVLEDGTRFGVQRVNGQDVIYTDKGVKQADVEFLPATETENVPAEPAAPVVQDAEGQNVLDVGQGGKLAEIPGQDLDARQTQMRADQSTPLGAAPIQTQGDLLGGVAPENADIPLLDPNQNKRQEAIGDRGTIIPPGPGKFKGFAQGTQGLLEMIDASELPANTKAVWKAFLETPVMKNLNWDGLRVELRDFLNGGAYGSRLGMLVELAESGRAATFPHEIAHILFDTLPKADQDQIEKWRQAELKKRGITDEQMLAGNMTSADFRNSDFSREDYALINASEFYAHFIGDKFAEEAFGGRNKAPSIWKKLRDIFIGAMDALKRTFGFNPSKEQIYRETLKGAWKPDLNAIIENEEAQASYSSNQRQARNAAQLIRTQQEQEIEATHQLAQSVDLTELFTNHGAAAASYAAQKVTGFLEFLGIKAVGVNLNNGVTETYAQLKARITDPYQRNWMARIAAVQVANFEGNARKVIEKGNEAFKRLTSTAFLQKVQRRAKAGQMKDNAKLMDDVATSMMEAAYKEAQRVLKDEAKSDLEIAEAEGALRAIDEAMKSSSAMSILINDMMNVLSSSPAGTAALSNSNVTQAEIKKIYRDIKNSAGQPISNPNLMNWASYILARNAELRDALWAAELARSSSIRAAMGPYETKFLADLEKDPLKTIRREMREAKRRVSEYERARFTYLTLNKEVLSELSELQSQLEAKEIVENILSDPQFKGLRKTVYEDAQVEGTQKPFMAFADKLLVLPSGRQLNVDPEYLKGSKRFFDTVRPQYLAAVAELYQWLGDPANVDDVNYSIHRRNLLELQDYFTALDVLRPADTLRMFNTALTIARDAVEAAGGRLKSGAMKALNRWNTVKRKGGEWNQEYSTRLWESRMAAMRSHNIKWSELSDNDIVRANRFWWEAVGNLLAYSNNRQQGGFKVGDRLPSGERVTREDMNNLKLMSEMGSAGYDIIKDDQITEDFLGNVGLFRKAIKGSEKMVRRVFNEDGLDFARIYSNARKEFQQAFRDKDQQAMDFYEQQMIAALNENWDKVAFPFLWDRSPEFAEATMFDGRGGAFTVIADRMLQRGVYLRNFDQLLDELETLAPPTAAGTPMSRDEIKRIVMVEWGRIINNWYQQAKDDTEGRMVLPVRGARAKNATTRSRNNALAPYSFYEYGFKDSRSVATFAGALHSRPLDRLVGSLIAIEEDLKRQISDLQHSPDPKAKIDRNKVERKNGETYDNYVDLESRKKKITNILRELTTYDEDQDVDQTIGRTLGAQTGLLVSTIRATTRNFTSGPLYVGTIANRLLGSSASVYPRAFWYSWLEGTKGWASVGLSGFKWAGKKLTYNIADIPKAVIQIAKGEFRGAIDTTFYGLADALGREAIDRVKTFKRLRDAGILYVPDFEKQRQNVTNGSYAYAGTIAERQQSVKEKIGGLPSAGMEFPLLWFRSFMPLIGDVGVNAATAGEFEGHVIPTLENRLRELFQDWQRTGYRRFDFASVQSELNFFSHQEMYPKALDPEKAFNELRKFFEEAGLSFDETAVRFMGELRTDPKAKWLTEDERKIVVNLAIDQVNRSSSAGSPMMFRQKGFWMNFFKPFMSWKARTVQIFNRLMSVPAQSAKSRKAQWFSVATMLVLPMLLFNAIIQIPVEETDRFLAKVIHDQDKSSRRPWERDGLKSQIIGWTINSTLGIPGLDIVMSMANDLPTRASLSPDVAMIEKAKDLVRYAAGVVQTGNPTFKLAETIAGIFPDAKIVLNRLDSEEGKRASSNVIALMRRFGNTELIRATGEPSSGVNYNELSPYGPAMENAVMRGDFQEFNRIFREAVNVARQMKRAEPEQAAKQMFSHRNPWDRAFKQKLTEGQRREFLAKLSDGQRDQVLDMERKFARAAGMIDASFNVTKQDGGGAVVAPSSAQTRSTGAGLRRNDSGLRRRESGGLRRR